MWIRAPEYDKRFANGDDYAGDAWRHINTDKIRWTIVAANPNAINRRLFKCIQDEEGTLLGVCN